MQMRPTYVLVDHVVGREPVVGNYPFWPIFLLRADSLGPVGGLDEEIAGLITLVAD